MNMSELLKLADLLEADAANENGALFDLNVVAERVDWQHLKEVPPIDCGTAACAIGLWGYQAWPLYQGVIGTSAAMKYFELSELESEWLFLPRYYRKESRTGAKGELAVAKRIRDFVAGAASP